MFTCNDTKAHSFACTSDCELLFIYTFSISSKDNGMLQYLIKCELCHLVIFVVYIVHTSGLAYQVHHIIKRQT